MATLFLPSSPTRFDVTVPVTGMTCAACVNRVDKAVTKVEGVERASVNLATERASVSFDPSLTTVAAIAAAIERAGYGVARCPLSGVRQMAPLAVRTASMSRPDVRFDGGDLSH